MKKFWQRIVLIVFVTAALLALSYRVSAQEIIRHPIPDSDFPIARAVEVPPGNTLVYVSGQIPSAINENLESNTIAAYGDTQTQTLSVLENIQAVLSDLNLSMGDVVKMQVFLVGDPSNGGNIDFAGFMEGYTQYFGTAEQPNLPARSAMQVAGLANPGWLVEIEVVALRTN